MKAIVLEETGGIENFKYTEIDKPSIKENELLIETKALGINPVDYKVRSNAAVLDMIYGTKRPAILGWDIAGVVKEKGQGVSKFEIGDRIFGMVNFIGAGNAYAEYVAAPENHIAKIPENVSFNEAAACTLPALTALQVLRSNVKKEDRVLIHAGSGGVGHFAIQIAKEQGAYVVSTSSAKNKDFIMSLGADAHIDYTTQAFEAVLKDIDFVFDMFNGEILHKSVQVVKQNGTVYSIPSPEFSDEVQKLAAEKRVKLSFHMVQSNADDMDSIAKLLKDGLIKPFISKTYPFEEMGAAHEHLESGRTIGKIVVEV